MSCLSDTRGDMLGSPRDKIHNTSHRTPEIHLLSIGSKRDEPVRSEEASVALKKSPCYRALRCDTDEDMNFARSFCKGLRKPFWIRLPSSTS